MMYVAISASTEVRVSFWGSAHERPERHFDVLRLRRDETNKKKT